MIEIDTLLRIVRPALNPEDTGAINESLAADQFDWTVFTRIALAHRLVPLVQWRIRELAPPGVPEEIAAALNTYSRTRQLYSRLLLDELHAVAAALAEAGVPMMTFKGPVFAAQAYPAISLREYNDLDIVIDRNDYRAAIRCLQSLGYHHGTGTPHRKELLAWRYYGQDILYNTQRDIAVEPHWRLLPATFPASVGFRDLWPTAREYRLEGYRFVSMSPEDTLLVLCMHHGKEHWGWLRQVCDVAFFMHRNQEPDWGLLLERAHGLGCRRALLLGLYLCRRLLATALPDPVVDEINTDKAIGRLGEEAVAGLLAGPAELPGLQAVTRFRFRLQDDLPRKLSYVIRTVSMPSDRHFRLVYLAPPLEFLYFPLRWVHDYLLLPVWKLYKRVVA